MGASGFGYDVARQFGLAIVETRPALVPLTFETGLLQRLAPLAGISLEVARALREGAVRGGDAVHSPRPERPGHILQISSCWREGEAIEVDMAPGRGCVRGAEVGEGRTRPAGGGERAGRDPAPTRGPALLVETNGADGALAETPDRTLKTLGEATNAWRVKPVGSEGYRTAEVTLGGVDTRDLDSRTMVARQVPGLYFIGEVVDVTGWLGGYNFQWAWASGWCAGQAA